MIENNNRGSFTIEVTYIFLAILSVIFFIIFIGTMLYERAYVQSVMDGAVQRAALVYANPGVDYDTGIMNENYNGDFNILDLYMPQKNLESKIEEYINTRIEATKNNTTATLINRHVDKDVKVVNIIIGRNIEVVAKIRYKLPFNILGIENELEHQVVSKSFVSRPKDFINNTDFLIDLIDDIGGKNEE